MSGAFFSDEAIYTYAGFAISKGVTPYSGITLPQPPLGYLLLAAEAALTHSSLQAIRTLNFAVYLIGLIFVFRVLAKVSSSSFTAFLGSLVYTLYPAVLQYSFSVTLEFAYFVALVFAGLDLTFSKASLSPLVGGNLLGLATVTWYPGFLVFLAVVVFAMARNFMENGPWRDSLKIATKLVTGFSAVIIMTLAVIVLFWRAYPQFVIQSLKLQTGLRAGFSPVEKLSVLISYWNSFSLVIVLGIVGIAIVILKSRGRGRTSELLLSSLFAVIFLALVIIPKVLFPHYFWFLTPILCYFTVLAILELKSVFRSGPNYLRMMILISLIFTAFLFADATRNSYLTKPFTNNVYTASAEYVGSYVANITSPGQLIWTSEAAIAFYADRLIVPPNSSVWKVQGFFDDVFNTTFTDTARFEHGGLGLVSPVQFEQSWGPSVKVLVFIRGNGPVPYPDTLLWQGWPGTPGVSAWVSSHYSRVSLLSFLGDSYLYEVWTRN